MTTIDGSRDTGSADDGAAMDAPTGPDGWVPWNDYDPTCGFYVPASKNKFPPTIKWEACTAGLVPASVACRQMIEDWGPKATLSPGVAAYASAGGVVFGIKRFYGATTPYEHAYSVVADADGPVHTALLEEGNNCVVSGTYLMDGNVVYNIADRSVDNELGKSGGGAVGGAVDSAPRVLLRFHDQVQRDYPVGGNSFLEFSAATTLVHTWSDPMGTTTSLPKNPADNGAAPAGYQYVGDAIFWNTNSGTYFSENAWTKAGGTKTLLSFGSDLTRGAYDFGTDGVDMVWHEGTGLTDSKPPAHVDIITAPYVTDGSMVKKRRLRSEYVSGLYAGNLKVGCGYAAGYIASDVEPNKVGVRITRLSDGVSWRLMSGVGTQAPAGRWDSVLAVTCTEVFVNVDTATGGKQVVRVRLDSLVNPEQPD
jgi:hypothetical protein